jgi:hypothetical protein
MRGTCPAEMDLCHRLAKRATKAGAAIHRLSLTCQAGQA